MDLPIKFYLSVQNEYISDQFKGSNDNESQKQEIGSKVGNSEVNNTEHGGSCWGSFLDNLEKGLPLFDPVW